MSRSAESLFERWSEGFFLGQSTESETAAWIAAEQARGNQAAAATVSDTEADSHGEHGVAEAPLCDPGRAVAIVGMSGFFPACRSLVEFEESIAAQRCLITPIPESHFRDESIKERRGAFIDDIAGFDPDAFNISVREAQYMDPRLRLLMMAAWHTFEDAGIVPASLKDNTVDVLVAAEDGGYGQFIAKAPPLPYTPVGASAWSLANRLSHSFALTGKSLFINAACTGGSVALHQAIRSLRQGEADYVLVGAANLLYGESATLAYRGQEALGILAESNTCCPFQKDTKGFIPAEAVVTVLLKRLDAAIRDRNRIRAVLLGSHVNHVGGKVSLTSPDAESQAGAMTAACADAGIDASCVTHIEAHGACTAIGDTQEVEALRRLERTINSETSLAQGAPCMISSIKPIFGHANSASGLVSLVRAVHAMQAGQHFGTSGFVPEKAVVDLAGSRFYVDSQTHPWERISDRAGKPIPRIAAVNNFSAGGVNAHFIIREWVEPLTRSRSEVVPVTRDANIFFLALSAHHEEQLVALATAWVDQLSREGYSRLDELESGSVLARRSLRHRVVFRFSDAEGLTTKLGKFISTQGKSGFFVRKSAGERSGAAALLRASEKLSAFLGTLNDESDKRTLFELWAEGWEEPLHRFLARRGVRRCSLPLYPFRTQRIWLEEAAAPPPAQPEPVRTRGEATIPDRLDADLRKIVCEVSGRAVELVGAEDHLADMGFDSLSLGILATRLSAHFALNIAPTVFFGHSTLVRLREFLLANHSAAVDKIYRDGRGPADPPQGAAVQPEAAPPSVGPVSRRQTSRPSADNEPIAIIGLSGRFPGARDVDSMWELLAAGRAAVTELGGDGREGWRRGGNQLWGAMLEDSAGFDASFFDISPREAERMDPRQRLLLQESWRALEDAAYGPRQISAGIMGMFVGAEPSVYQNITGAWDSITDNSDAVLAARLAYFLDFSGPNMAINTACSSGLVAAHQACLSLRARECDAAVVGAVNMLLAPELYVGMSRSGMLSPDGKCRAFARGANGIVPGEAVVALVLKRLADAQNDGDPIRAVILGSGINYDGRTNGITAPSAVSQTRLLTSVYERHSIAADRIEYVVAHGTGTPLGDPVEVEGLCAAFAPATSRLQFCALTSAKPNFGHAFAASGLVSLACLVQALGHERIPPTLYCEHDSEFVDWKSSPFYVNRMLKDWPRRPGEARLGAVSAFGVSGTNAHMVVQGHD